MTKEITIQDENISYLAEEIKSIISQARDAATMGMIAAKYMVGEAIVGNPLYKKYAKSQAEFYQAITQEIGVKSDTLADCVRLYEEYPKKNPKKLSEKLYLEHGAWRNVRLSLYGGSVDERNLQRSEQPICRHCPKHCPKV